MKKIATLLIALISNCTLAQLNSTKVEASFVCESDKAQTQMINISLAEGQIRSREEMNETAKFVYHERKKMSMKVSLHRDGNQILVELDGTGGVLRYDLDEIQDSFKFYWYKESIHLAKCNVSFIHKSPNIQRTNKLNCVDDKDRPVTIFNYKNLDSEKSVLTLKTYNTEEIVTAQLENESVLFSGQESSLIVTGGHGVVKSTLQNYLSEVKCK